MTNLQYKLTKDSNIRQAFKIVLKEQYKKDRKTIMIEELGLSHGSARVDLAVINGIFHGFEFKSDKDTLNRLPYQAKVYNTIFDKVTLIVGKAHIFNAINMVPDWWGITLAKFKESKNDIAFLSIRSAKNNPRNDTISIARLLWKDEALSLLAEVNYNENLKYEKRAVIYTKIGELLHKNRVRDKVKEKFLARVGWKVGGIQKLSDD